MLPKFSAYLQIYNDWSVLEHALNSLVPYIDELIIVDGAYEWMVPYVKALGLDPVRSDQRVYDAVERSGIPYRSINRTWKNQIEKRIAGYTACQNDYIFRVDADEVFLFDDGAIERLLTSGSAVGEMTMPTYLAPGWVVGVSGGQYPRQCFFFDRRKVSPELHLNYLWLVLEFDKRPAEGQFPYPIYPESLAFNAHLTAWRTADTSANRTAYYTTNWYRGHGVPWLQEFSGRPLSDFDHFFQVVPPAAFRSILDIDRFSLGKTFFEPGESAVASNISHVFEASFVDVYTEFLASLTRLNERIRGRQQAFIQGWAIFLDASTLDSRSAICNGNKLTLKFSVPVHTVIGKFHMFTAGVEELQITPINAVVSGDYVELDVPDCTGAPGVLRQLVELSAWSHDAAERHYFEVIR